MKKYYLVRARSGRVDLFQVLNYIYHITLRRQADELADFSNARYCAVEIRQGTI